jgi:hypothetical protein
MDRIRQTVVVLMMLTVPAGAHALRPAAALACIAAGSAAYRIAAPAQPADYTVKVEETGALPNLHMQFVDDPDSADFVLVDDVQALDGSGCRDGAVKTVRLADPEAADAAAPDITVSLDETRTPPNRIYVRSTRYSRGDAVALAAVMWTGTRRHVAARD